MREKVLERKLGLSVRAAGGLALKFVSPGLNGVPDRILLLPGGRIAFCEVKAPGEKPRPLQLRRMEQLREMGFSVYVIDSEEQIAGVIREASDVIPARAEGRVERSRLLKAEGGPEGDRKALRGKEKR